MTTLIDGKAIAQQVRNEIRDEVAAWVGGRATSRPGLATVLVGDDAASAVYVGGKQKACAEVGIRGFDHRLPRGRVRGGGARAAARAQRRPGGQRHPAAAADAEAHRRPAADRRRSRPGKDVDGLTPISTGLLAKNLPACARARRWAAWSCSSATT